MLPLLLKDGQLVTYLSTMVLYTILYCNFYPSIPSPLQERRSDTPQWGNIISNLMVSVFCYWETYHWTLIIASKSHFLFLMKTPVQLYNMPYLLRLHRPVFGHFGASGRGGFGKIIFGSHNKLFSNALYQREPYISQN